MLSANSFRCLVAAAGIAGLGAAIPATAAQATPVPATFQAAAVSSAPDYTVDAAGAAAAPTAAASADYTVVSGDTLSEIAAAKDIAGGWPALYEANRALLTQGPDWIYVGQVLKLAGVAPAAQPKAEKPAAPKAPAAKLTVDAPKAAPAPKAPAKSTAEKPAQLKTDVAKSSAVAAKAPAPKSAPVKQTAPKASTADTAQQPAPAAASGKAATAIAYARAQLGKPYQYGAAGPNAFDCSGLMQAAWKAAGVSLPRVTTDQINAGTRVSTSSLKPGDLVFYYSGISHVGMYIGDGKIIHAPNSRSVVKIVAVDSMPIAGAVRVG
ncbi:C40 family peptidase [Yinghuangia soli]|uniref:LysM peptidoglycan-binding domain-containing C40 family peptidase n=1 Tax=Yinghuangia soli TaxID=2908204 RepID=A0AA41U7J7_9ACTN|nr:LysM peptidoglycan-binding domain-containing C40 family peptidase [Yinghuangia soli]MCF2532019.1 LysM peptidoglycan-binding domain-containing C40 family peptidase [Yinghuangia soli]